MVANFKKQDIFVICDPRDLTDTYAKFQTQELIPGRVLKNS